MTERLRMYEQMNIQQLIAEKKKSETIVESIADPIIVTDEHGMLVLMNQAAAAIFDVRGDDWRGRLCAKSWVIKAGQGCWNWRPQAH